MEAWPRIFPYALLHHGSELNDELALRIMKEAAPRAHLDGTPVTHEEYSRWLDLLRGDRYAGSFGSFAFRVNKEDGAVKDGQQISLGVSLVRGPVRTSITGTPHRLEPFVRNSRQWATIWISSGIESLDWERSEASSWLLDRIAPIVRILRPNFGFMEDVRAMVRRIGSEPSAVVWPWMLWGPELVASHGREAVLATPAWKVEELPLGALTIRAGENALLATRSEVRKVAEHLGLKNPR